MSDGNPVEKADGRMDVAAGILILMLAGGCDLWWVRAAAGGSQQDSEGNLLAVIGLFCSLLPAAFGLGLILIGGSKIRRTRAKSR